LKRFLTGRATPVNGVFFDGAFSEKSLHCKRESVKSKVVLVHQGAILGTNSSRIDL
jgi:hypothetical protein